MIWNIVDRRQPFPLETHQCDHRTDMAVTLARIVTTQRKTPTLGCMNSASLWRRRSIGPTLSPTLSRFSSTTKGTEPILSRTGGLSWRARIGVRAPVPDHRDALNLDQYPRHGEVRNRDQRAARITAVGEDF